MQCNMTRRSDNGKSRIHRRLCRLPAAITALITMLISMAASAGNGAPILLYHHVSAQTPASTSITPQQFEQHMAYLHDHYTVLPLIEIVKALKKRDPLPDNAIAVTFDDGYANILENGHPVMQQYNIPYTVFINPAEIGQRRDQLTWEQVKSMQQDGVIFANHTLDHLHMLNREEGETEQQWLKRVVNNVEQAEKMIKDKTGRSLRYLAYPFGEYNRTLATHLQQKGYIGFGQHSGAAGPDSDFAALPRFPAAGPYASLNSLKAKMASLPMPVSQTSFTEPQMTGHTPPASITLTIKDSDVRLSQAACYFQGNKAAVSISDNSLTVRITKDLPTGRSRVNCTAPSNSRNGRFYWYSQPFFVADANGHYPD